MSPLKLLWLSPLFLFAACANGNSSKEYNGNTPVPASIAKTDTTAVTEEGATLNDRSRKIIYTADFHCKVADVFKATSRLERLVKSVGGLVQESHMDNTSDEVKTSYYKADSLRQTQTYNTTAMLTLRVPSVYVDSVINSVPGIAAFIDSRTLKQSDVTWMYLSNELKNEVNTANASASIPKKSSAALVTREYEDNRQEQIINRKITNLQLTDDVSYATITVALTQPAQVYTQIIVNPEHIRSIPFLLQCEAGIMNGWNFVSALVVGLINIWPIILLTIAGIIVYRKARNKRPVFAKR